MLSVRPITCSQVTTPHHPSHLMSFVTPLLLCLIVQHGESALQIAVRRGHLDVIKALIQVYRDSHMESEIDQYYMDLADDHHHEHVVGYLSSEFPALKRKVSHHSLHALTYSYLGIWAHHLLLSHYLSRS